MFDNFQAGKNAKSSLLKGEVSTLIWPLGRLLACVGLQDSKEGLPFPLFGAL